MGLTQVVRVGKYDRFVNDSYPTVIGNIMQVMKGTPGSVHSINTDSLVNALKESLEAQSN
jgi:hypothetical protein